MRRLVVCISTAFLALLLALGWHLYAEQSSASEYKLFLAGTHALQAGHNVPEQESPDDPRRWMQIAIPTEEDPSSIETRVMDGLTGGYVDKTLYVRANDRIYKITPNNIQVLTGSFSWRFFECGIRGDKTTWFTRQFWALGSTTNGEPTSLLRRAFLDPTNPTPFYVLLVSVIFASIVDATIRWRQNALTAIEQGK